MEKADEVISQLLLFLYKYPYCSKRVLYDMFQAEKYKVLSDIQYSDIYTEKEVSYIIDRIEQYDFVSFIQSLQEEEHTAIE